MAEQREPVALRNTALGERVGGAVDGLVELGVGEADVAVDDRRACRWRAAERRSRSAIVWRRAVATAVGASNVAGLMRSPRRAARRAGPGRARRRRRAAYGALGRDGQDPLDDALDAADRIARARGVRPAELGVDEHEAAAFATKSGA